MPSEQGHMVFTQCAAFLEVKITFCSRIMLNRFSVDRFDQIARHVLNRQLGSVALQYPSDAGKVETDIVFNDGTSVIFFEYGLYPLF